MAEITPATFLVPCAPCNGQGGIDWSNGRPDPYGHMIARCSACSGTGQVLTDAGRLAWRVLSNHHEQAIRERTER